MWYLPHNPVINPLKPQKVRIVVDCAAHFAQTLLSQQLLQGVLSRFCQETVGLLADGQSMFHKSA